MNNLKENTLLGIDTSMLRALHNINSICCCEDCDEILTRNNGLCEVRDSEGNKHYVCKDCRDNFYVRCDCCGEYYPIDDITEIEDTWQCLCPECLDGFWSVGGRSACYKGAYAY